MADPKGPGLGSSYLGPVACSLPACRLMGVLWLVPAAWPAQQSSSVLRGRRPGPPRQPPGVPCIFNDVYYSCFVSGKEPEQLTEEPGTAWQAGQWARSTPQLDLKTSGGALAISCQPSAWEPHKTSFRKPPLWLSSPSRCSNPGSALRSCVHPGQAAAPGEQAAEVATLTLACGRGSGTTRCYS